MVEARRKSNLSVVTSDNLSTTSRERIQYRGAFIQLQNISVLPQGRKTFENIDELAEDIADKGLISPPLIAKFSKTEATAYLDVINTLWDTNLTLDILQKVKGEEDDSFYLLIAGERRYRASTLLTKHACVDCSEVYGNKGCFSRHFPTGLEVRICENISPMDAVYRQASENTHNALLAHEEAPYYDRMYKVAKMTNPRFSLIEFARKVGRGEDKVRDALRFCSLPEDVQDLVRSKIIPYGIAIEIARMADQQVPNTDIDYYIKLAGAGNMTVGSFTKLVGRYLEIFNSGNMELFSDNSLKIGNIKPVVDREATRAFWIGIFYLEKLAGLFNDGLLGKEDSPFSSAGPINALKAYVRSVTKLLPHMEGLLPARELERVKSELHTHKVVIDALDQNFLQAPNDVN